ncbi:alpha/beta fold hydrolase [Burkholderia alba]|uniref:alpha/beta fold hydrolase n=1 Tax=Burkholderia alba TaxID=2683677 RepID=UPI002B05B92B|nr:alpha/beta hydrolase [Burkholderia alba]
MPPDFAARAGLPDMSDEPVRTVCLRHGRIAYVLSGAGEPTVVLETGLGAESAEWRVVRAALARRYGVLSYDRPGRGRSDPPPAVRSAAGLADELRDLLRAVSAPGPYLLVGHSFGGLLVRTFAERYRADVCGLVLAESMHARQFDLFAGAFDDADVPESPERSRMRAFWTGGWRDPEATPERIDLEASLRESAGFSSLGELPVTVVTANAFARSRLFPDASRGSLQARWDGLQHDLLRCSARAVHISVPASEHFVQRDAPQALVEAIVATIGRMRASRGEGV